MCAEDARKCQRADCSRSRCAIVNDRPNSPSLSCAMVAELLEIARNRKMSVTRRTLVHVTEVLPSPQSYPTP